MSDVLRLTEPAKTPFRKTIACSVEPGMRFRHFRGKVYVVRRVYEDEAGHWVVYQSETSGKKYERPFEQFAAHEVFDEGIWVPRFQFIGMETQ